MTGISEPRFVKGGAMLLAGLRRSHRFEDAAQDLPRQWQAFHELGLATSRVCYGVFCASDPQAQTLEYMCATEVSAFNGLDDDIGRMRVPQQQYAVFTHPGSIATLRETWESIWREWLPGSGREAAATPDFERYGSGFDPASGSGDITVWFPVKPE